MPVFGFSSSFFFFFFFFIFFSCMGCFSCLLDHYRLVTSRMLMSNHQTTFCLSASLIQRQRRKIWKSSSLDLVLSQGEVVVACERGLFIISRLLWFYLMCMELYTLLYLCIVFVCVGFCFSCEVIKDQKSGESLQYAFVEFENVSEMGYSTMAGITLLTVLIGWTR